MDLPLLPCRLSFAYRDAAGSESHREVHVFSIGGKEGAPYLEGFCELRQEMRTFRVERIRSPLTDMETGEIWSAEHLLVAAHSAGTDQLQSASKLGHFAASSAPSVLFTGFTKARRAELGSMAMAAGWEVRSTVGPTLDYLVTGPAPGPSKVQKAQSLGIPMIDEFEFENLTLATELKA